MSIGTQPAQNLLCVVLPPVTGISIAFDSKYFGVSCPVLTLNLTKHNMVSDDTVGGDVLPVRKSSGAVYHQRRLFQIVECHVAHVGNSILTFVEVVLEIPVVFGLLAVAARVVDYHPHALGDLEFCDCARLNDFTCGSKLQLPNAAQC